MADKNEPQRESGPLSDEKEVVVTSGPPPEKAAIVQPPPYESTQSPQQQPNSSTAPEPLHPALAAQQTAREGEISPATTGAGTWNPNTQSGYHHQSTMNPQTTPHDPNSFGSPSPPPQAAHSPEMQQQGHPQSMYGAPQQPYQSYQQQPQGQYQQGQQYQQPQAGQQQQQQQYQQHNQAGQQQQQYQQHQQGQYAQQQGSNAQHTHGAPMQPLKSHGGTQYRNTVPLQALTSSPAPVNCPSCGAVTMTHVNLMTGNFTHAVAAAVCFFTCLGCIPYCISGFKDCEHKCGNCGVTLATWHRSGRTEVFMFG